MADAGRIITLIDGQEYFEAFAAAAERAQHSILILAWDFDSRTRLYRSDEPQLSRFRRLSLKVRRRVRQRMRRHARTDGPEPADAVTTLGEFLNGLTQRNRALQIRILIWDYPMLYGLDREFPPLYGLGWRPRRHVHVRYDNSEPLGGSHHQKIVVIDDQIAFCGGLDLTARRWDTCQHKAVDSRRVAAGTPYPPFHDTMMAVDGDAARALGNVARERWHRATGEALQAPGSTPRRRQRKQRLDAWPPALEPTFTHLPVAISRTLPQTDAQPAAREVEQLYLDMISQAKHLIYIENQYFTAHRIGDALARRLAEPQGPQIVLILRLLSHGWLEAISMEALRTRLLMRLRDADAHGRFHYLYPTVGGLPPEQCIDVHAKLMIVDDEILRIGSANLANRSMGLDSECDLAIEAGGNQAVSKTIAALRNRLLSEHLGVEADLIAQAHAQHGSLGAAIEVLRRPAAELERDEHTLQPFEDLSEPPEAFPGVAELADPERPVSMRELLPQFAPTDPARGDHAAWGQLIAIMLGILALVAAWRWTPLAEFATAERIKHWSEMFADAPWAPIAVILAYTPACYTMFPRPLITLFAVLAFGPLLGFALAMSGNLLAGWVSYVAGKRISHETLRRLAGPNFSRISTVLRQRGVMAVTAVRLVPLAPYAIPGMVAGAAHVRMWHFLLGTFLGLLPGVLTTTVFGDALQAALEDSSKVNYWIVGSLLVVFVAGTWWVRKWLLTTRLHPEGDQQGPH